ncbi:DUF2007 domain-containing protein [Rhodocaloribacter litoris]|uniref:putative signal transducing protein n=1 Tax=Rhodocaloribacter litoris TaxID=2558931 RepID=UPI00141FA120|nr:DUF2007 domain-containing protein [Rhodocaloribacter litoris]QXD15717.1 DUF2007 domain-containing protein [Rhodocaloribacter litoris]GIV60217.1 MAG: hypothetical protein KatS3mg043_1306 [Rhodothermaceae bacterium]
MSDRRYEGWVSVYMSGTDYEADLVRDRLDDAGIPAVVLTQRDHAFNLTMIEGLARVHVMVPPEHEAEARALLASEPISDEELEAAALAANPEAPPAHADDEESMLDSGNERIRLSTPEEGEEEEDT